MKLNPAGPANRYNLYDTRRLQGRGPNPSCFEVPALNIHTLASVSPAAEIGRDVEIGPFCVVESGVAIGDGCVLESNVVVKAGTSLGPSNHIYEGAVLGGLPQHVHVPDQPGRTEIGSGNTIREHVTIHRALEHGAQTTVGDGNFIMAGAHVGHDCHVGNQTIITNTALLGGHVLVEDRAYVSGAVAVHQFCRIGTLAMVGGHARIIQDVPPYVMIDGASGLVVGLNQVGLRRAGYPRETIRELKAAYRLIYREFHPWEEVLARLSEEFSAEPAAAFHRFLSTTKRGIVSARQVPHGATLKLRREAEDEPPAIRAKAG
jgi:UDP-N-acetylglucosamine acyltransferase